MKNFKRFISLVLALVMCFSIMTTAFAADGDFTWDADVSDTEFVAEPDLALTTSFKDVKTTAWYYADVTECAKLGIVQGFADGTFKPDDKVTSVQFLVMLTRTFYNAKVEAVRPPAGSKWYYANTKVAEDVGMSKNLAAVDDNPMNRYNMAMALSNTMTAFNKQANSVQMRNASTQIKDWTTISKSYTVYANAVANCYAKGIITGMTDGSFSGASNMTRAQACTVIMRMLKLINNYNPGDKDNETYDDGKSQDTGNNGNQNNTGKLANGKAATTANVLEVLAQIQREYPEGTTWGPRGTANNNYYAAGNNASDAKTVINKFRAYDGNTISTQYACGGWANMVSSRIFGQTGAPGREVTDPGKVRPGDIVIALNADGKASHIAIVCCEVYKVGDKYAFQTCDGNFTGGTVSWGGGNTYLGVKESGKAIVVYTRYPA